MTGKVWFDDLKFAVAKEPITARPNPVAGPVFTGHSVPRLRGAITASSPSVEPPYPRSQAVGSIEWHWDLYTTAAPAIGSIWPGQPGAAARARRPGVLSTA